MNILFISKSQARNAYFKSDEATNEIYFFSLHEMKLEGPWVSEKQMNKELSNILKNKTALDRSPLSWHMSR